jgi:hypothetical protein
LPARIIAAHLSKASFSPVAKCKRMCFKEPRRRKKKKRHDILKVPTENIEQADLPGLALSKKPKLNTQLSRVELGIGVAILLVLLGLRWFYLNAQPWDSDEPQHLHVVWAWANGMLPYRDVFDNHSPLFQAISAPLFALLGERTDIVTAMRWTMVPIVGLILAMTYLIGPSFFRQE